MKAVVKNSTVDYFQVTIETFLDPQPLNDWMASFGETTLCRLTIDYDPIEFTITHKAHGDKDYVKTDDYIVLFNNGRYKVMSKLAFFEEFEPLQQ